MLSLHLHTRVFFSHSTKNCNGKFVVAAVGVMIVFTAFVAAASCVGNCVTFFLKNLLTAKTRRGFATAGIFAIIVLLTLAGMTDNAEVLFRPFYCRQSLLLLMNYSMFVVPSYWLFAWLC